MAIPMAALLPVPGERPRPLVGLVEVGIHQDCEAVQIPQHYVALPRAVEVVQAEVGSPQLGSGCDILLQNLLSLDSELSQLRVAALRGGREMLQSLCRVSLRGQDCAEPVMCQMV